MRKIFTCIILIGSSIIPQKTVAGWIRTCGQDEVDEGYSVLESKSGAYVAIGISEYTTSDKDLCFVKMGPDGDTITARTHGGEEIDLGSGIEETPDNGFILVGTTKSFVEHGDYDLWLVKTDSVGDTLWTRVYGTEKREDLEVDFDLGLSIQASADGNYIVLGYRNGDTEEYLTYTWLLKIDDSGDTIWTRTFNIGIFWSYAGGVCQTTDGGYILTGSVFTPLEAELALFLIKTDSSGDALWTRLYSGVDNAIGSSIHQTIDDGFIVLGSKDGHVWLLKTDEQGDTLWTKTYDYGYDKMPYDLKLTSDNCYIVTGFAGDAIWLEKMDASGNTIWSRTFGEETSFENRGTCVQETSDGGYIITGRMYNDLCMIKTDSLGLLAAEEASTDGLPQGWKVLSPIGSRIVLQFNDLPQGFRADIFDATGCKVDEIRVDNTSGQVTWGKGFSPGIYFICSVSGRLTDSEKVILYR